MRRPFEKKQYLLFSALALALGANISWTALKGPTHQASFSATDAESQDQAEVAVTEKASESKEAPKEVVAEVKPKETQPEKTYTLKLAPAKAEADALTDCTDCGVQFTAPNKEMAETIAAAATELAKKLNAAEEKTTIASKTESKKEDTKKVEEDDDDEDEEEVQITEDRKCERREKRGQLKRLDCNIDHLTDRKTLKKLSADQLNEYYEEFVAPAISDLLQGGDERDKVLDMIIKLQKDLPSTKGKAIKMNLAERLKDSFTKDVQEVATLGVQAKQHQRNVDAFLKTGNTERARVEQIMMVEVDNSMKRQLGLLNQRYRNTDLKINQEVASSISQSEFSSIYRMPFSLPVSSMLNVLAADPYAALNMSPTNFGGSSVLVSPRGTTMGRYGTMTLIDSLTGATPQLTTQYPGLTLPTPTVTGLDQSSLLGQNFTVGQTTAGLTTYTPSALNLNSTGVMQTTGAPTQEALMNRIRNNRRN